MLLVQQYLETHSFGDLAREHGVYASLSKSGHKFSLNYDQIEAKEADPLAQECRGLILARQDGSVIAAVDKEQTVPGATVILAYPMKRFFNYGQGSAAQINWSDPNLAVLEKLDGTLCIIYYDLFTRMWCVATRSVPEADLLMDNGLFTFRTLFERAVEDTLGFTFDQLCAEMYENYTYCFELTTPYNRIVVAYPHNRITLLAARNMDTLEEVDPKDAPCTSDLPIVQAHTYTSTEDLLEWVSSLNPMDHEGVVVRDSNFNRIKVKNAAYVAYNKVRDKLATSTRNCLEIILLEKEDDVLPLLPEEIANNVKRLKVGLQQLIKQCDTLYQSAVRQVAACQLCDSETQVIEENSAGKVRKCARCGHTNSNEKKTFALHLAKHKELWSAPLFNMFSGKSVNMKDFIVKNKKEGTWPDGFLDKLLDNIK